MCRGQRNNGLAIGKEEQADLLAGQEFFDQDADVHELLGVSQGRIAVVGDDNALAGSQAVGLDHVWSAKLVHGVSHFLDVLAFASHAGWHSSG